MYIEEISRDLAQIEWDTQIDCPDKKQKNFHLRKFHPSVYFTFDFETTRVPIQHEGRKTDYYVSCRVFQNQHVDSKNKDSSSLSIEENGFKFPCEPIAIWVQIDSGERLYLKRNSDCWQQRRNECLSTYDESTNWHDIDISFKILIQFPTLSGKERRVLDKLTIMLVHQTNCDVNFQLGNEQIGSHVSVLSAMSPVFAAMFKNYTKESQTRQVVIENISMATFKELLNYVYSSRIQSPLKEEKAILLYQAAHKYDIADLMEECVDHIATCCIRVNNVLSLMSWANLYSIDHLTEVGLSFIGQHSQKIYEQENWSKFIKEHPDLSVVITRFVAKLSISS